MASSIDEKSNFADDNSARGLRIAYDPRISLNTIIMCLTAVAVSIGIIDKISANAVLVATLQAETKTNSAAISQINAQRNLDRQELLMELRDIKLEIGKLRK